MNSKEKEFSSAFHSFNAHYSPEMCTSFAKTQTWHVTSLRFSVKFGLSSLSQHQLIKNIIKQREEFQILWRRFLRKKRFRWVTKPLIFYEKFTSFMRKNFMINVYLNKCHLISRLIFCSIAQMYGKSWHVLVDKQLIEVYGPPELLYRLSFNYLLMQLSFSKLVLFIITAKFSANFR
jgi:hypothetical protein